MHISHNIMVEDVAETSKVARSKGEGGPYPFKNPKQRHRGNEIRALQRRLAFEG